MCGYAVTAQVETVTQMEPFTIDTFLQLYKAVGKAPKPAVIVLQEIGGFRDYAAHCGEVMATFFTRLGAVGLVTDCAVHDLPEVRCMESNSSRAVPLPATPIPHFASRCTCSGPRHGSKAQRSDSCR